MAEQVCPAAARSTVRRIGPPKSWGHAFIWFRSNFVHTETEGRRKQIHIYVCSYYACTHIPTDTATLELRLKYGVTEFLWPVFCPRKYILILQFPVTRCYYIEYYCYYVQRMSSCGSISTLMQPRRLGSLPRISITWLNKTTVDPTKSCHQNKKEQIKSYIFPSVYGSVFYCYN